jgi:hypothetical protein
LKDQQTKSLENFKWLLKYKRGLQKVLQKIEGLKIKNKKQKKTTGAKS